MVDQGRLSYDRPVAHYWPEFGRNGKEQILISDVLRHESKLHKLSTCVDPSLTLRENIKKNKIGELIENETLFQLPHGVKRTYHLYTRDWISNEVFRRVDKWQRTMGEYVQQEWKDSDIHIGVRDSAMARTIPYRNYKAEKGVPTTQEVRELTHPLRKFPRALT